MMNEVFSVPMSLGGLSNCEAQLADALEHPYNETIEHIRKQDRSGTLRLGQEDIETAKASPLAGIIGYEQQILKDGQCRNWNFDEFNLLKERAKLANKAK